jgi:hypothetical protein
LGIERCGKRNALNSFSDNWTGIGVVAGFCAGRLIKHWPHLQHSDVRWRIRLLYTPQELRPMYKTRNQLHGSQRTGLCEPIVVEQDHRFVKRRVNPGLGFGAFATAQRTIQGDDAMHRLHKGQIEGLAQGDVLAQNRVINQLFGLAV